MSDANRDTAANEAAAHAEHSVTTFSARSVAESGGRLSRWLGSWGIGLGAAIPLAFWTTLVVLHPHGSPPGPLELFALFASTWLGPLAALASRFVGRKRLPACELRVKADHLVARSADARELSWARSEIAQGVELGEGKAALELRSGARVEIALEGRDASRVLDAIGLGPTERRAVFRWRGGLDVVVGAIGGMAIPLALLFLAPSVPLGALVCPILSGAPWLLAGWLGGTVSQRSIEIGADALVARGRLRTVLARFADLVDARAIDGALPGRLELVFRDGRREKVLLDPEDVSIRAAVLARLETARAGAAARPEGQRLAELLANAGKSFADLRAMAARLLVSSVGFRDATVTETEVAALLDDPQATAEQRIAAAIALAARDGSGRARVRVAAESCASPKLRVALDAAAEGTLDDAMLEEAEMEAGGGRESAARSRA